MKSVPMTSALAVPFLLAVAVSPLPAVAQDAPAAEAPAAMVDPASERLVQQLRAAARVSSAEFEAAWKWPVTVSGAATTTRAGSARLEKARGRFCPDGLLVQFDRSKRGTVQVLQAGRFKLAQQNNEPWQFDILGGARVVRISYVPDPQQMLLALAAVGPTVGHREIVEVDGHPVERVGWTMRGKQIEQLQRAGILSDPNPMGGLVRRMRQANVRGMNAPQVDETPVDVVVEFDVATKHVTSVRMRAVTEELDVRAAFERMGRGRRGGGAVDEDEQEKPKPRPKKVEPTRYENGMPARSTTGMNVYTIDLLMRKHGQLPALELSDEQKKLLGR